MGRAFDGLKKTGGTAMFLINEILNFTPGRRKEALDRLSYIHGLMAPSPGFVQALV
jgi:hypothetical protein